MGCWKGAVGLGTLGWALYGTVSTLGFGRSPSWDAHLAFGIAALLGGWFGATAAAAQGARQTRT